MVTTVEQEDLIWGRNVVTNALKSGRALNRVLIGTERGGGMAAIRALAQERRILVENASRQRLDDLTGGAIHQGVVAFTAPRLYSDVADILARAEARGEPPLGVVLAHVEDPRNLGATARTAAAAGAHGIIIPMRRAARLPCSGKSRCRCVDHIPVARVVNLRRCLNDLAAGLWAVGPIWMGDTIL